MLAVKVPIMEVSNVVIMLDSFVSTAVTMDMVVFFFEFLAPSLAHFCCLSWSRGLLEGFLRRVGILFVKWVGRWDIYS